MSHAPKPHAVAPLPFKPPRLNGLSERLVASHYENNYGGALRRLNAIDAKLARLDWDKAPGFEINGLKREQLIAANSVILHEAYFDALGGPGGDPAGELAARIEQDFGSIAAWRREFTAMGKALGGGSGWVLLCWSPRFGCLINQWAADHTHGLGDGVPLLALDMYEHAYHLDFGANAAAYVDAFMANIHWERVAARFGETARRAQIAAANAGPHAISAEDLRAWLSSNKDFQLLDVRQLDDLAKGRDMILGAHHADPMKLDDWAGDLVAGKPVIAYCVYGFQVSADAVATLRARGFDAHALSGGIAAWHAIGGQTIPKTQGASP